MTKSSKDSQNFIAVSGKRICAQKWSTLVIFCLEEISGSYANKIAGRLKKLSTILSHTRTSESSCYSSFLLQKRWWQEKKRGMKLTQKFIRNMKLFFSSYFWAQMVPKTSRVCKFFESLYLKLKLFSIIGQIIWSE